MENLEKVRTMQEIRAMDTPRIQNMKNLIEKLNDAGIRRNRLYQHLVESAGESKGMPQSIRLAKAFCYHLEHIELDIYPHEQIIGSITGMWPIDQEYTARDLNSYYIEAKALMEQYLEQKKGVQGEKIKGVVWGNKGGGSFESNATGGKLRWASLMAKCHYDGNIPFLFMQKIILKLEEEYNQDHELEPYEIGKLMEDHFKFDYGDEVRAAIADLHWNPGNHTSFDYPSLLQKGLPGLLKEICERRQRAEEEKKTFYEASEICVRGIVAFVLRYAKQIEREIEKTDDAGRKEELKEAARIFCKLAEEKPQSFQEAIQFVWILHLVGNLAGGSAMSLARFDQYMNPYYISDLENGVITRERAFELVCSLFLKMQEPKMRVVQSACLGGVTPEGKDAANAFTKLCLEAIALLKTPYPNVSVRLDPELSPDWLYREVIRTVKAGNGMPLVLNDKIWVKNLSGLGMSVEDAREYYNMGCTEIMIAGKDSNWGTWAAGNVLEFPNLLMDYIKDCTAGGEKKESFEAFLKGYLEKLKDTVDVLGERCVKFLEDQRKVNCDPLCSALVAGCLESGTDYYQGGTTLGDPLTIMAQGLGTTVDSLSAIQYAVYDKQLCSLEELEQACLSNFEGQEALLSQLKKAPAFGNDEDQVDEIASRLFGTYSEQVRYQNERFHLHKARIVNNVFSYNFHIQLGENTPATPNGRLKGEALSDCIGPTQGADQEGPTAMLNSILKLPQQDVTGAYALNLKVSPSLIRDEAGTKAMEELLKVYIAEGGAELQFNYVDSDTLKKAQEEPEKHRDVVVRIAGYCEYFVNLDHKLQNEIIARTQPEQF